MPDAECTDCTKEDEDILAALFASQGEPDTDEPDPRGNTVTTWRGLLAPVQKPTGDGRRFAAGALTHAPLPSALRWQREDGQGHTRSVAIGTLDRVEYAADGAPWGSGIIFQPDPEKLPRLAEDVNEAMMLLDQKVIGPSVDLDSMQFHALPDAVEPSMAELAAGEGAIQKRPEIQVDKGRIRAATLVQIPAFAECGPFELGEMDADEYAAQVEAYSMQQADLAEGSEDFAQLAHLGMDELDEIAALADEAAEEGTFGARFDRLVSKLKGHVDNPAAVAASIGRKKYGVKGMARLAAGVAAKKVHPLAASAVLESWEAAMTAAAFGAQYVPPTVSAEIFRAPEADRPTPLTITDDGRVFGHVADYKTCHTGFSNRCERAPKSPSGYAYFHTGAVRTDEGDLGVGRITLGAGHADLSFSHRPAAEHYDNTATAVAEVRAKDGKHGIWVSGRIIPGTSQDRVEELRRSPLSGDWRPIGGRREMIAALAVNSGGFPIPRVAMTASAVDNEYEDGALVAAGALMPEGFQADDVPAPVDITTLARQAYKVFRAEELAEARREKALAIFAGMDSSDAEQEPLRRKMRANRAAKKVLPAPDNQAGAAGMAYAGDPGDLAAVAAFARKKRAGVPAGDGDADDAYGNGVPS